MAELYLVPEKTEPELGPSIVERAKSEELPVIDEYLRRELGGRAVAIITGELVELDHTFETTQSGQMIDHTDKSVAGVFMSIEWVIARRSLDAATSSIGKPEDLMVAVFSTSHGPAEVSDDERQRMQNNDTSVISLVSEIGVPIGSEVTFGPLVNNNKTEEDEEKRAGYPSLRVVE